MVDEKPRPKILGIGYPKFAINEWEGLAEKYDIHYFVPGERKQVISEVKRLCDEQGPFDAAYVVSPSTSRSLSPEKAIATTIGVHPDALRQLFNTAAYSPFHPDMLSPLFDKPGHCGLFAQGGAGESTYSAAHPPFISHQLDYVELPLI
jgi:hypothetical protein